MPSAPVAGGTATLARWPYNFMPRAGDYGALFQTLACANVGTGGVALTGTATTTVYVAIPASRYFEVVGASHQGYLGFTGASAITAQLVRINNQSTPANVALTAAQDITTTVFTASDNNVDFPVTATQAQAYCQPGDTLVWKYVCVGNVTAGALQGSVEVAIRK